MLLCLTPFQLTKGFTGTLYFQLAGETVSTKIFCLFVFRKEQMLILSHLPREKPPLAWPWSWSQDTLNSGLSTHLWPSAGGKAGQRFYSCQASCLGLMGFSVLFLKRCSQQPYFRKRKVFSFCSLPYLPSRPCRREARTL